MSGIIPSITGKIELVYEGEQEGLYQVATNLLDKAIRTQFIQYFPNPETFKNAAMPKNTGKEQEEENPYKPVIRWFDAGNGIDIFFNVTDKEKLLRLYKVDGLHAVVKNIILNYWIPKQH